VNNGGPPIRPQGELYALVTLTIREGKSSEFKSVVLNAVHGALIASGVAEKTASSGLELSGMTSVLIRNP